MDQNNLSPEQKLQHKIQSLFNQQKALEQKQAQLLYRKCKALMKEEFQMGVIFNILEEAWAQKTPEQLARWRRPPEPRFSKTHESKSAHPKAPQKVQNENQKGSYNDTIS